MRPSSLRDQTTVPMAEGQNVPAIIPVSGDKALLLVMAWRIHFDCSFSWTTGERTISTRRIRVIKYRGSNHGTTKSFVMITMAFQSFPSRLPDSINQANQRVSTGIPALDNVQGCRVTRGSTILGQYAGTGKQASRRHSQ